MSAVFLDTVGFIALWDQADQWHVAAESAFRKLEAERRACVTTTYVLLECGNAVSRRPYRTEVVRSERALAAKNGLIVPTNEDWEVAWLQYAQGEPGDAGIVDCISMAVMRRLKIAEIFSNDQHFKSAGFETLF